MNALQEPPSRCDRHCSRLHPFGSLYSEFPQPGCLPCQSCASISSSEQNPAFERRLLTFAFHFSDKKN